MDIVKTNIEKLEKGNAYVVDFDHTDKLEIITVIEKFENSSIIRFEYGGEEQIVPNWKSIILYEHISIEYMRKNKLDKII